MLTLTQFNIRALIILALIGGVLGLAHHTRDYDVPHSAQTRDASVANNFAIGSPFYWAMMTN